MINNHTKFSAIVHYKQFGGTVRKIAFSPCPDEETMRAKEDKSTAPPYVACSWLVPELTASCYIYTAEDL